MINFSESCVFCNSTEDLNTAMTISIDDKDYKIAIGDSCEDSALPKKIKEALKIKIEVFEKELQDKKSHLEKLKESAAELGFELVPIGTSARLNAQSPQAPPKDLSNAPVVEQSGGNFRVQRNTRSGTSDKGMNANQAQIALEVAQRKSANSFPSTEVGGATEYQSHVIPESAQTKRGLESAKPTKIAKVNQTVPGRCGIPTTIPEKLIGSDGQTEIKVVDTTGSNNLLQRRMRALNQARMQAEAAGIPASAQPHDTMRACPSCDGVGKVKNKVCIRCQGNGFMGVM